MKLKSIHVKNFKTIEDLEIEFNDFYTAISGKNNAGKTNLISVLRQIFKDQLRERFVFSKDDEIRYQEAKTQWITENPDIELHYEIIIGQDTDPGLYQFVKRIAEINTSEPLIQLRLSLTINLKNEKFKTCKINKQEVPDYATREIFQKLANSNLAFIHDSTARDLVSYYGRMRYLHEIIFTNEEKRILQDEQKKLQNKVKNISKAHKLELSELLGNLEDKYEVEFSMLDMYTGALPFSINLKDKNVDIPLDDWGSGTKNRTHILMSILQAKRIKSTQEDPNRITPFVIIEEPESFLHPSGQAEFGRVLRKLARELDIQIIVTTHSPYMLSQEDIQCNILLERKIFRNKLKQTEIVKLQESNWMMPFSLILGLDNSEFEGWKSVLHANNKAVLLVEGDVDKKYLEHINSLGFHKLSLPKNIEIVSYGGKDALKNTILLKFIIQKFEKIFITFDLDAKLEIEKFMKQINLEEGSHYLPLGINKPGQECIEGLVHDSIRSEVFSKNTDLIMKLSSQDASSRRSAKSELKQKILEGFKNKKDITEEELKNFQNLFKTIRTQLSS